MDFEEANSQVDSLCGALPRDDLRMHKCIKSDILGHWLDMVYLPPRGNFVDHIFLEAQCLARILQHVSPLTMAALSCNSLLHTLPYKIFDN